MQSHCFRRDFFKKRLSRDAGIVPRVLYRGQRDDMCASEYRSAGNKSGDECRPKSRKGECVREKLRAALRGEGPMPGELAQPFVPPELDPLSKTLKAAAP